MTELFARLPDWKHSGAMIDDASEAIMPQAMPILWRTCCFAYMERKGRAISRLNIWRQEHAIL